ncbi:hypothetical protein [Cohaesibacter intestini]|uniref:hypothetical protein n=1 Tax=Cohaesibacter intestini TaxID=2211145 RepID=UPI000DEB2C99|nr:hypothetical protein [Cohaesibacter intestini]
MPILNASSNNGHYSNQQSKLPEIIPFLRGLRGGNYLALAMMEEMQKHVAARVSQRNQQAAGINWKFSRNDARQKFKLDSGK